MQSNNMNLTNNSEDESEKNDSFHLSSEDSDEASNLLRVNSSYTNKRPEE